MCCAVLGVLCSAGRLAQRALNIIVSTHASGLAWFGLAHAAIGATRARCDTRTLCTSMRTHAASHLAGGGMSLLLSFASVSLCENWSGLPPTILLRLLLFTLHATAVNCYLELLSIVTIIPPSLNTSKAVNIWKHLPLTLIACLNSLHRSPAIYNSYFTYRRAIIYRRAINIYRRDSYCKAERTERNVYLISSWSVYSNEGMYSSDDNYCLNIRTSSRRRYFLKVPLHRHC